MSDNEAIDYSDVTNPDHPDHEVFLEWTYEACNGDTNLDFSEWLKQYKEDMVWTLRTMAKITSLSTIDLFGGERVIMAQVSYLGQVMEVNFYGRQKGRPRHVKVKVDGTEVPVPFPGRYGDQFNEDWVQNYWNSNTKEET